MCIWPRGDGIEEFPGTALRGPTWLHGQDHRPTIVSRMGDLLIREATGGRCVRALQRGLLAVIPDKVAGVDLDPLNGGAGHSEFDDDPVEGLRVMSSCLPSIVPGPRRDEHTWTVDGRRRYEQV